ncbi:MAG: hypothetical protein CML43_14665 [Rhodobacteraceae bacterium]|nr:hypothetical protein [Paracoccaceae bacterium]
MLIAQLRGAQAGVQLPAFADFVLLLAIHFGERNQAEAADVVRSIIGFDVQISTESLRVMASFMDEKHMPFKVGGTCGARVGAQAVSGLMPPPVPGLTHTCRTFSFPSFRPWRG